MPPLWPAATPYAPPVSLLQGGGWRLRLSPSAEQHTESPINIPFRSKNSCITGEVLQTKPLCQCFHINLKAARLFIFSRNFPVSAKP